MEKIFINKIKNFILKVIYCPQKIFFAGGKFFFSARPTTTKNNMVAFRGKDFLKIEIFKHRKKKNNLTEEANILKYLTNSGNISQPKFIKEGHILSGHPYFITERFFAKGHPPLPDILLSILEQQKCGIFHRDIKFDNVIFDGTVVKLIDYDQAEYREELKPLSPYDSINYFIKNETSNWVDDCEIPEFGKNFDEALANCLEFFNGKNFNFEKTTLYQKLTNKSVLPYYSIDNGGLFAKGRNDINKIKSILDNITFSENEKVLDFGCNTGALSFYLKARNCDVYSFDSDKNAEICTKMLSNILGLKCCVLNLDIKKNKYAKQYDTILLLNDDFYNKFKIENIKYSKKLTKRFIAKIYDFSKKNRFKGYEITKTYPVEGEDFMIAVYEKIAD